MSVLRLMNHLVYVYPLSVLEMLSRNHDLIIYKNMGRSSNR